MKLKGQKGHKDRIWQRMQLEVGWRLFTAVWSEYTKELRKGATEARDDDHLIEILRGKITERVNDPRSSFYLNGE